MGKQFHIAGWNVKMFSQHSEMNLFGRCAKLSYLSGGTNVVIISSIFLSSDIENIQESYR